MPNIVYNTVNLKGSADYIKGVYEAAQRGTMFNHLIPMPDEIVKASAELTKQVRADTDIPLNFMSDDEYEWATANWGTKWPPMNVELGDLKEDADDASFDLEFETAWNPPLPIYYHLRNKGCKVDAEWRAEIGNDDFDGSFTDERLTYTRTHEEVFD